MSLDDGKSSASSPPEAPHRKVSPHESSLFRSAGVVSAAIALSRITGLLRESILGWLFGASAIFDAYVLGFRIPMLSRELLAEGALSSAFVPTFTRYLTTKGDEAARELANIIGTLTILVVGVACAVGIVGAPLFVDLFAPGFAAIPGKRALAISLTRIMFPFLLFVSLSAQAQGILNANRSFGLPALSSSIFNIASIVVGLAVGTFTSVGAVYGMAFGVLVGGAVQTCFLLPAVWRAGFGWRPQWNLRHEGVRYILMLMGPALLGSASTQINALISTNFATGLRDASGHVLNGPVSWLSYALRFSTLPLGLFGVAIASATLPRLSRNAASADWPEFRSTLSRSLMAICLLALPSTAGLIVVGDSMIALVYQHGRFLAADTHQTALALSCYALGLTGAASLKVMVPAFYALGDARTPMFASLSSVAVNATVAYSLIHYAGMGHAALALSSAAVASFTCLLLVFLIRPRIGGLNGRVLLGNIVKIAVASLPTAGACYLIKFLSHRTLHGKTADLVDVCAGIPVAAAAFYGCATALGVSDIEQVKTRISARIRGFGGNSSRSVC